MPALLTREEMEQELIQVFPPKQAAGLLKVLGAFREMEIERAANTRELRQGLIALTEETKKLAEAQRRSEERLGEFERRTEERFAALAEAQRRTEESVARLGQAVEKLTQGFERLREAVGELANRFGFDLEDFVSALLPPYLERHYGIADLRLERRYFDLGGGRWEEVDLVGEGRRNGQAVTALVECRTTVGGGETARLAEKLDAVVGVLGARETVKVIVAMNIHPTAEPVAQERGMWLIPYSRINRERG